MDERSEFCAFQLFWPRTYFLGDSVKSSHWLVDKALILSPSPSSYEILCL